MRRHYDDIGRWVPYFEHESRFFHFASGFFRAAGVECTQIICRGSSAGGRWGRRWCIVLIDLLVAIGWFARSAVLMMMMRMVSVHWHFLCGHIARTVAECGKFIRIRWLGTRLRYFRYIYASCEQRISVNKNAKRYMFNKSMQCVCGNANCHVPSM